MSDAPCLFALNVADHPVNGSQIGIIAKRTYNIRGGRCIVADEQVALVEQPRVGEESAMLLHDVDVALNRTQVDVVVSGKIHARGNERRLAAQVRVGALDRRLLVFGDRRCWRDSLGHLRFSAPEPIGEVDVGWTSAYGGVDMAAVRKHGDPVEQYRKEIGEPYDPRFGVFAYPRNRAGKGYLLEPTDEALHACALPNLEDPSCPLVPERIAVGHFDAWPGGPPVASLGWLSYHYFPRAAMAGVVPPFDASRFPEAAFFEVKMGALNPKSIARAIPLTDRLDVAVAQQSAIGMRVAHVAPSTPIELSSLHQRHSTWAFALSDEVPRMQLQLPGTQATAVEPRIRTILLEPGLDRICIVWVGQHHSPTPVGPGRAKQIRFGVRWDA